MRETGLPPDFHDALASLRAAPRLPEVALREVPGPARLAPWTAALALTTLSTAHGQPLAHGHLVVLYDEDEPEEWRGPFRLVGHVWAQVEAHTGRDPLVGEAVWSWAHDSLLAAGAGYHDMVGTVTRELSESFGGLRLRGSRTNVELRCSWSPVTRQVGEHLLGWSLLLCRTTGIAPRRFREQA